MIGKTISHYKILEELGRGGMGEVYLADDTDLDRKVALKFLPLFYSKDKEVNERFKREAKAAAALNHNNIITVYEIGIHEGQSYIAMEYVEGESLREKINKKEMTTERITDITTQICKGLSRAHQAGIVHRDIKPENILINKEGIVKILDFGLAQKSGTTKLTKETSTLGTVNYMSPEQCQGVDVDQRTDIWSLGVVLYEMLSSQLPFKGDYEQSIMYAILNEEPEPINGFRTEITLDFERILNKVLAKNPDERYQHADEMLVDLEAQKKKSESSIELPIKKKKQNKKKRAFLYLGALTTSLLILISSFFIYEQITKKESSYSTEWQNSIAILPFKNISSDTLQEYVCSGLTEQLITNLTKLDKLLIINFPSILKFKDTEMTYKEIGKELEVANICEGSVFKVGEQIRITAKLINTEDASYLWADDYDEKLKFDQVFDMQDRVCNKIATSLLDNLTLDETQKIKTQKTSTIDAYDAYFLANYYRNNYNIPMAIETYKKVINIDPNYSQAYARLAQCYLALAHMEIRPLNEVSSMIKENALRAFELDSLQSETHIALAGMMTLDWKWTKAEKHALRAIELDPNNGNAYYYYGSLLQLIGRHDESIEAFFKFHKLDPLSYLSNFYIGWSYFITQQSDKAINQLTKTLEMYSSSLGPRIFLAFCYSQKGSHTEAISIWNQINLERAFGDQDDMLKLGRGIIYANAGRRSEAIKLVNEVENLSALPVYRASLFAILGDKDNAFEILEECIHDHHVNSVYIKIWPFLENIRSDDRFVDLINRIGFP